MAVATGGVSEIDTISKAVVGTDISGGASQSVRAIGSELLVNAPLKKITGAGAVAQSTTINVAGISQPVNVPVNPSVPIFRGGISGGVAAQGSFINPGLGGGNPAWRSSGVSAVSLATPSARLVGSSGGTWVQSSTSVRLL